MKRSVLFIIVVLIIGFLVSACSTGTGHVRHRGSENWGAVLGYTPEQLRAMSPEEYRMAYQKSKAAADANADWARSEAEWYKATSQQGQKSFAEEIFGTFTDTVTGFTKDTMRDIGNETRYETQRRVRDVIRD